MIRAAFIILGFLLALPVVASADALYTVTARIAHDGVTFATPVVVVKAGVPAQVSVPGVNGYKLSLTVTETAKGRLKVEAHFESSYGSISPKVIVDEGELAYVSVDDLGFNVSVKRQAP